ncbi:phage tail protein, partial [Streptococcus pneumoniae]|nr:phage tail protein [Streptococcus pneumoniae]
MTQENKVTFGLENVHIAPIKTLAADGVITYGDVFRFPGAMELILDTKGETT